MYLHGLARYIHAPSGHDNGDGNGHGHGLKRGDDEVVREMLSCNRMHYPYLPLDQESE